MKEYRIPAIFRSRKPGSMAIIGNAPSALNYEIGELIDAADCVVRINNFRVDDDLAPYIGTKTDVFVSNLFRAELEKSEADLLELGVREIWSSIACSDYIDYWPAHVHLAQKEFPNLELILPALSEIFDASAGSIWEGIAKRAAFRLLHYRAYRLFGGKRWAIPSSGIMAIYKALKLRPQSLIITGFNFFMSDRKHYFSDETTAGMKQPHDFAREPYLLMRLIKSNPKVRFLLAVECDDLRHRLENRAKNVEWLMPVIESKHASFKRLAAAGGRGCR